MDRSISTEPDHRERVAAFLSIVASDSARDTLGRRIDPERLAFELCRIWFAEIYLPGRRYIDSLKGDYSETAAARFRSAFSEDELADLERFNRFLELRTDMLSGEARRAGRMPNNDAWHGVARHASYLLNDLEPDAEYRRARLSEVVADVERSEAVDVRRLISEAVRRSEG